jgi:hypothetical protein
MVRELGLAVTFTDLNFPKIGSKFDDDGKLLDQAYDERVKGFLNELVWMSRVLKWGREYVPSKYH